MSKSLDELRSDAKAAARLAMDDMKAAGLDVAVTATSRSLHDQMAHYAQGRCPLVVVNHLRLMASMLPISESENKYTVTECDGDIKKSAHQDDRAFDVVLLRYGRPVWNVKLAVDEYKRIGEIGKTHGFAWGGDFKPLDPVTGLGWDCFHFEMA